MTFYPAIAGSVLLAVIMIASPVAAADDGVLPVRIAIVAPVATVETARYAATLQPRIESSLAFRVSGKVIERLVDVGDRVVPGTVLERIDPTDLALSQHTAEARVAAAASSLEKAEADFSRGKTLIAEGWMTRPVFEGRRQARDAAAAEYREATQNLKLAQDSLGYSILTADAAGVITTVSAEPGQVVSAGQEVFRLAHSGEIEAVADLPEQMVARLSHTRFEVTLWADPDVRIAARLRELAPSADPATRTYRARLTLINPPGDIQLGMTATVLAEDTGARKIVLLPMTALFHDGQNPAVWVLNDGGDGIALRPVVLAAYLDDQIAISSGLKAGDRVVTAGAFKLTASDHVRIWSEPER